MRIWLHSVTGVKPNDLDNINNLNHYIGMKRIEPDSIPELRFMPFVVGGLIALAGAAAVLGRRRLAQVWLATFAVVALVGLIDFYRWEYDYGHNLDMENAIIKVPGMSYQPPLIGTKQLLNFHATSLPAAGAYLAFLSMGLGLIAVVLDRKPRRSPVPAARTQPVIA
jgi:copper chaperone NosL